MKYEKNEKIWLSRNSIGIIRISETIIQMSCLPARVSKSKADISALEKDEEKIFIHPKAANSRNKNTVG